MASRLEPAPAGDASENVTVAPLLAWRILIGIFAFGSAWTLVANTVRLTRGEAVGPEQFVLGALFLAVAGWLFPQTVVIDDTGIEMRRYFGLMRTRIAIEEIDFYWPTTRLALKEFLRTGSYMGDAYERAIDQRQPALLITARRSTKRIVLSQYHVGRDRIVEELKRRGVRHFSQAVKEPV